MKPGPRHDPTTPPPGAPHRKPLSSGAEFMGVGLQLGATFVLFALLGKWLDEKLGTSPWLILVMVFVGAAAGFTSVYRRVIGGGGPATTPANDDDERAP